MKMWKSLIVSTVVVCSSGLALAQTTPPASSTTDQSTMQNQTPDTTTTPSATPSTAPMMTTTPAATTSGITFSDPSQTITVQPSSPTFTLTLQSNKTTGYSWFVKSIDHQLVKMVSHKYVSPQQAMPGAGGYEQWTFMVRPAAFSKSSTTSVKMIYARPWEKKSAKEVVFTVSAQQNQTQPNQ